MEISLDYLSSKRYDKSIAVSLIRFTFVWTGCELEL